MSHPVGKAPAERQLPTVSRAKVPFRILFGAGAGGVLSGVGLTGLMWATNRWAMHTIFFTPRYFWSGAALSLGAWAVVRYWRPASEPQARHARRAVHGRTPGSQPANVTLHRRGSSAPNCL